MAGPCITEPDVEKVDPWHGQTKSEPENALTGQPSCVQEAVSTVAALADVRVKRKLPSEFWVTAMPPAEASAVPVVETVTVRPLTVD